MNILTKDSNDIRSKLNSKVTTVIVILLVVPKLIFHCIEHSLLLFYTWPVCQLFINYNFGFTRRAFLGTIVHLLSSVSDSSYESSIKYLLLAEEILFSAVILTFLIIVINRYKDASLNLLIILFTSLNLFGFYFINWGEADIVLMTLTMLSCFLIVRNRYLVLVPVLASVCVLIHEGYVMMYLGLVISLLLYTVVTNYRNSGSEYLLTLIITVTASLLLFVYLYFYSLNAINVPSEHFINLFKETGVPDPAVYDAFNYIYYGVGLPNAAMWVDGKPTNDFYIRMLAVIINTIVLSPLVVYKLSFCKSIIKDIQGIRNKLLWCICLSSSVLTVPLILVHTDEGRWFYDIVFFEFMLVFFLYIMDKKKIRPQLQRVIKCSFFNVILFVVYLFVYENIDLELILLNKIGSMLA